MAITKWSIQLQPGDIYPFTKPGILQLSQISLMDDPVDGKTTLKLQAKGLTYFLCSLVKDKLERQELTHSFIAEDNASLIIVGQNPVEIMGTYVEDDSFIEGITEDIEEDDEEDERETISGQPRYANYLSDLLGPDLPDEDDDDYEDMDEDRDDFGTLAFRDPTDTSLLGGFELRHFNLAPQVAGFEPINLREQEEDMEDTLLNDNIARGLVNALINTGDEFQVKQGKEMLKKLKKQCKQRNKQLKK